MSSSTKFQPPRLYSTYPMAKPSLRAPSYSGTERWHLHINLHFLIVWLMLSSSSPRTHTNWKRPTHTRSHTCIYIKKCEIKYIIIPLGQVLMRSWYSCGGRNRVGTRTFIFKTCISTSACKSISALKVIITPAWRLATYWNLVIWEIRRVYIHYIRRNCWCSYENDLRLVAYGAFRQVQ